MDPQPTKPQPPTTPTAAPTEQAGAPGAKQPPDQKTVDALLMLTRNEHDERYRQKVEDMSNVPKGLVAGYIGRRAHAFSPAVLSSSPQARRAAIILAIVLVVSVVLTFVL